MLFLKKLCSQYGLVNPSALLSTLRWHFDFCIAKIGMPQKGLKKDDGVRGRREKISSKVFPSSPIIKQPLLGTAPLKNNAEDPDRISLSE